MEEEVSLTLSSMLSLSEGAPVMVVQSLEDSTFGSIRLVSSLTEEFVVRLSKVFLEGIVTRFLSMTVSVRRTMNETMKYFPEK